MHRLMEATNEFSSLMEEGDRCDTNFPSRRWWGKATVIGKRLRSTGELELQLLKRDTANPRPLWVPEWMVRNDSEECQWYSHPESSCVFLDREDPEHDGLAMQIDETEAFDCVSEGYALSALHTAILYKQMSQGY